MNIYIGNLPSGITENQLRQEFVTFGEVKSVSLMNDCNIGSGQLRICGFVEMVSKSEGIAAINYLQGRTINGHTLSFIEALPVTKNTNINSHGDTKPDGFSRKAHRQKI
jgi:RNA recognition motif-containing protein